MNFSFIQPIVTKMMSIKDSLGAIINPATSEKQDLIVSQLDKMNREGVSMMGSNANPVLQMENNEIATYDTNIANVLGTQSIVEGGSVRTRTSNTDTSRNDKISGLNGEVRSITTGFSTSNIQITGTWVGTITFEITTNGGDFVAIAGVNAATNTLTYTTTGNGIFRFNVSGIQSIRVRFSAWTSGIASVYFLNSSGPQWQPFAQNAAGAITTTEAVLDTNLPFIAPSQMYETGFELESQRWAEPTVAPTQPTTYAQPRFASYPQKFRRLRTQIAGSEMLPFAQEKNTNKMVVTEPEMRGLLELMYIELQNIRNVLLGDSNTIN